MASPARTTSTHFSNLAVNYRNLASILNILFAVLTALAAAAIGLALAALSDIFPLLSAPALWIVAGALTDLAIQIGFLWMEKSLLEEELVVYRNRDQAFIPTIWREGRCLD
jgi:hypothetical protein